MCLIHSYISCILLSDIIQIMYSTDGQTGVSDVSSLTEHITQHGKISDSKFSN